jgi:hypothetical protein
MTTVYVTQEVMVRVNDRFERKFDLSSAEQYGGLVFLIPSGQSMLSTVPVVRQLKQQLAGFSDNDYLLPIGDPSIMAIAAMVAGERTGGRVKILKWDRRSGCYIPVQVDTSGRSI